MDMVEKTFCDILGCKEEAYHKVDSCMGWLDESGSDKYLPFQRPTVRKIDLCPDHHKQWCIATYGAFWALPTKKEMEGGRRI
jgi:hypothetical protein